MAWTQIKANCTAIDCSNQEQKTRHAWNTLGWCLGWTVWVLLCEMQWRKRTKRTRVQIWTDAQISLWLKLYAFISTPFKVHLAVYDHETLAQALFFSTMRKDLSLHCSNIKKKCEEPQWSFNMLFYLVQISKEVCKLGEFWLCLVCFHTGKNWECITTSRVRTFSSFIKSDLSCVLD